MINVRDYGAVGDGAVDDRDAFQRALNAGDLLVPAGRYVIGGAPHGVAIPAGRLIRGEPGAVLAQAPGSPPSSHMLRVEHPGVTIMDIGLDGQADLQLDLDEHRHGLMCTAEDLALVNVSARGFTGDGIYLYVGSDHFSIVGCTASYNLRNGLTIGSGSIGGRVSDSRFIGNRAQQFDSEPRSGQIRDLEIIGCLFDGSGISDQHVLTVSGSSPTARAEGWTIEDCRINGGVHVTWGDDIRIRRCRGMNPTKQASVSVYRTCDRVVIEDCDLETDGTARAVITATGTAEGGPARVIVRRGSMRGSDYAFMAEGAVSTEIYDADMRSNVVGVYLRATSIDRMFKSALVRGARIEAPIGLQVAGNGAARMTTLSYFDNTFDCSRMSTDLPASVALDIADGGNVDVGSRSA